MGQQQLILLVLATVIVGLAIVVGIRAFTENSAKANADAMTQDLVRVASDAQAWKKKAAPFGGQSACTGDVDNDPSTPATAIPCDDNNFTGATFANIGYTATNGIYTNLNGRYLISAATDGNLVVQGYNDVEKNHVTMTVTGMTDANIAIVKAVSATAPTGF